MSDSKEGTPKITSVEKTGKIIDPNRVTADRRLAQISKAAKGGKIKERTEAESDTYNINHGYVIGAVGLVVASESL